MKKIIYFFILLSLFAISKEIIDLKSIKKDFYVDKRPKISVIYNYFDYPMLNIVFDTTKLSNPLYTSVQDKNFWLHSEFLIFILQQYKFINSKYVYFFLENSKSVKNNTNINFFLKIKVSNLKNYNNRDFGENDTKLLDSDDVRKYKLFPIKDLLKSIEIVSASNTDKIAKKSNKLTKEYRKFAREASFEIVKYIEYKIEENREVLANVKKNIHSYCISGDYKKIKFYIKLGFDIDAKDKENHQTLLQYAASNGHYKVVKLLINNGANPNIHKKGFENAYLAAKRKGYSKIVKLLKPLTKIKSKYTRKAKKNRYIVDLGYASSKLSHNSLWSRDYVTLNDGTHIYINLLEKSGGCYSLLVGSNESNIYGYCSNCSDNLSGYWSCSASNSGSF